MKITTKTTRQELKDILGANALAVKEKDKDLFDRISYASKMAKEDDSKVNRKDLVDLVKETMKVLGESLVEPTPNTPVEPQAENSVKLKSSKKVVTPSEDTPAKAEEKVDTPKEKSAKKSSLGKKSKKDDATVLKEETVQNGLFPQTLELKDGSKYELASDIKDMDDLYNAINKEETIFFAFYWTKADLKKFPYFDGILGRFTSFEKDFDLATCFYISDEKVVAYGLSMYTEAFYTIIPEMLEEVDGVRYAQGIEFQIYRPI